MGVFVSDAALDAMLAYIADRCDLAVLCSAEPTNLTEAVTTYALADVAVTPGDGNGDFTIGNTSGGRLLTLAAQNGVTVDVTGTGTHIAFVDAGTALLAVVQLSAGIAVTAAGTVNLPACTIANMDAATS